IGLGDHVKILDFGLARLHHTEQNLTSGIVVGTPAYMAPEQIRGEQLDHRADLYACGVLLFELLTGAKPFHSENDDPIEVCRMHPLPDIPRLGAALPGHDFGEAEAVISKALAKRSDDRYASAQEFAAEIDAVVPRRAQAQTIPPVPRSGPVQIASADVMEAFVDASGDARADAHGDAHDASYPPALEVRTADVLSVIPADAEPAHGAQGDGSA